MQKLGICALLRPGKIICPTGDGLPSFRGGVRLAGALRGCRPQQDSAFILVDIANADRRYAINRFRRIVGARRGQGLILFLRPAEIGAKRFFGIESKLALACRSDVDAVIAAQACGLAVDIEASLGKIAFFIDKTIPDIGEFASRLLGRRCGGFR